MEQYAFITDYTYCTGCHSCEVACRKEKGLPTEEWGVKLAEMGPKVNAGVWQWDYVAVPNHVCDYCVDRLEKGQKAFCEHHCLAQCIQIVPIGEVGNILASKPGHRVAVFTH